MRLHDALLLALFATTVAAGCDKSPPPEEIDALPEAQTQAGMTDHNPAAAAVPAPSTAVDRPSGQPQPAPSLKLTVEVPPAQPRAPAAFGQLPAADWLERERPADGRNPAPGRDPLLPNVFDRPSGRKHLSMEGELLLEEEGDGRVPQVEGAGLSIEFKTR